MDKLYYFAYGLDMDKDRLQKVVGGEPVKVCNHVLFDYELSFSHGDTEQSYINIMHGGKGSLVEGVLYELNAEQIQKMDAFLHYPDVWQKKYLVDKHDIIFFYFSKKKENFSLAKPRPWYVVNLIKAAQSNNLTDTVDSFKAYVKVLTDNASSKPKKIINEHY